MSQSDPSNLVIRVRYEWVYLAIVGVFGFAWRESCAAHDELGHVRDQTVDVAADTQVLNGRVFSCETKLSDLAQRVAKLEGEQR